MNATVGLRAREKLLSRWYASNRGSLALDCAASKRKVRLRVLGGLLVLLFAIVGLFWPHGVQAQVERVTYHSGDRHLIVEFLDDDLIHVEMAFSGLDLEFDQPLYTTPMVDKRDYPGPSRLVSAGIGIWETSDLRVRVHVDTFCVTVTDLTRDPGLILTTACPDRSGGEQAGRGLTLTRESFTHVYGLGQEFRSPPSTDGDWAGRVRSPGNEMGNAVVEWNGGAVGNIQFPIAYMAGAGTDSYALFLDHPYAQRWDLTEDPWTVQTGGDPLRFYLMSGPDLRDLRQDYMELVGRPPVPARAMFGLWVSEYGYDDWAEAEEKLRTLRANGFPVDGFVLDLQWFGGVDWGSRDSPAGSLTWDRERFPDPESKIAELRDQGGVGIMLIEHAYVSENLDIYDKMKERGYLVRVREGGRVTSLRRHSWGRGGMVDWTQDAAGAYWHDQQREPLIEDGIVGHWTDLGEPMNYDPTAWYWGLTEHTPPLHAHADVHNLLNLLWSRSIYEGYARNGHDQRPFVLSRSGAPGSQRYGVALWSADIGANSGSLAAHLNAQMHMSMSGVDYYGSDIGGFHRPALEADASDGVSGQSMDDLYTVWLANGLAFDLPARPHTLNLCNCQETAPDRMGDVASNLDNVRQRYALIPYLYSLAHRAYLYGEPLAPPLVYQYPGDPNVREMGDQKLLGRDLLVATVTRVQDPRKAERCVYLPAGEWADWYTGRRYRSEGAWFGPFPTWADTPEGARFRLPMFARAGAIVPQMHVDERTMNALGQRTDGSVRDGLIARVYADETRSTFTLYEDDGRTLAYQLGEVRTTPLSQVQVGATVTVTVGSASGRYAGASIRRDNVVDLVVERAKEIAQVGLAVGVSDTIALNRYETLEALDAATSGWVLAGPRRIVAKSGKLDVALPKVFTFVRPVTLRGEDAPGDADSLPAAASTAGAKDAGYDSQICCQIGVLCQRRGYLPLVVKVR
jgi:alpha-glucosidase (family GH31 glycosyl hydrolase)